MDEFPSNSQQRHRPPEPKKEAKKVEQVITSEVVRRKKTLGRRFTETFLDGNAKGTFSYVFGDVIIPAIKDTIADAFNTGIERLLFGDGARAMRRPGWRPGGNSGYTNYSNVSQNSSIRRDPRGNPRPEQRRRSSRDIEDIIIPTRHEAIEVLDQMHILMQSYEQVTVADLYELVGINTEYTDNKWGWIDIQDAGVSRVRNGFLLNLPRPDALEK